MGFMDKLLGREPVAQGRPPQGGYQGGAHGARNTELTPDEAALDRYRYLLRTAPPDRIEEAHAEAFAKLTPEQRTQVLTELSAEVPPAERAASDDPRALARMATRAEMRQPGTLERSFGRSGGGMGMGGLIAGSLLASVAGAFIGTAIADAMFDMSDSPETAGGEGGDAGGAEAADAGGEGGGDFGGDFGGGDFGGDFGGF